MKKAQAEKDKGEATNRILEMDYTPRSERGGMTPQNKTPQKMRLEPQFFPMEGELCWLNTSVYMFHINTVG